MAKTDKSIRIDVHGMYVEDAMELLQRRVAGAPPGTEKIVVVHGYNRGTALKEAVRRLRGPRIVEVAPAEELFDFPLHPYTHSLISAVPIPDPKLEKRKELYTYDPSVHDYSTDKPEMVCIGHDHYVYGSKKEIEEYRKIREKNEPVKSITIECRPSSRS